MPEPTIPPPTADDGLLDLAEHYRLTEQFASAFPAATVQRLLLGVIRRCHAAEAELEAVRAGKSEARGVLQLPA